MSQVVVTEAAAPGTPASGKMTLYAKTDSRLYHKDDAGTERQIATTSSSIALGVALAVALG
jgi:hypothetical protein